MVTNSKPYMNFLGGEVSPNVYKRLDMANNGKWFETAKDIYFGTTGDFYRRHGFKYIGIAGAGIDGEKIKLIPFVFNRREAYCIEISSSFFRVLKDGNYLKDTFGNVIEVSHPGFSLNQSDDLSYTQIGDMVYLCNGSGTGVYVITREAENEWTWSPFQVEIPPMKKTNEEQKDQISFTLGSVYSSSGYFAVNIGPVNGIYSNMAVDIVLNGVRTIIYNSASSFNNIYDFVSNFNTSISGQNVAIDYAKVSGADIVFYLKTGYSLSDVTSLRVKVGSGSYSTTERNFADSMPAYSQSGSGDNYTDYTYQYLGFGPGSKIKEITFVAYADGSSGPSFGRVPGERYYYPFNYSTPVSGSQAISDFRAASEFAQFVSSDDSTSMFTVRTRYVRFFSSSRYGQGVYITHIVAQTNTLNDTYYNAIPYPTKTRQGYIANANFNFFSDKNIGDIFAVESIYSPNPNGRAGDNKTFSASIAVGEHVTDSFWSNGTWRIVTSGLFSGTIELQYSYDGSEWFTHRTFSSSIRTENNVSYSTNYNEYGTIDSDDNILLRLKSSISTATNLMVTFDTESFKNRSYYKIVEKDSQHSNSVATVLCIKGAIGTPGITNYDSQTSSYIINPIYEWAEPAWSSTNGYPKVCFTFQNRLGVANTQKSNSTIWFSRTDNYKDFSTKVEYSDDDPVTVSVLKPTGISEITCVAATKKLFIFSGDREYGLKDDGGLTQSNKELVSFSSYGAEAVEPRIVSNRVIFVERGGKAIRSLVYDYSQENYEAPDLSIPFKHLLENEQIISSEYVSGNYKTYIMLTSAGRILLFKYIPEQRIEACSWFKHASGPITNVCVVETDTSYDMYVTVDAENGKRIEYLPVSSISSSQYLDSFKEFSVPAGQTVLTDASYFVPNKEYTVSINDSIYRISTDNSGNLSLPAYAESVFVGIQYVSEATLIEPNFNMQNGTTNYNRKNMYKAHFTYENSEGFKVGVKNREKSFKQLLKIEPDNKEHAMYPRAGERSFIIQSSYLEPNMLSFVQEEPYPMHITNAEVEVDYGGK